MCSFMTRMFAYAPLLIRPDMTKVLLGRLPFAKLEQMATKNLEAGSGYQRLAFHSDKLPHASFTVSNLSFKPETVNFTVVGTR